MAGDNASIYRWAARVALALLVLLVSAEMALQAAHLLAQRRAVSRLSEPDAPVILCLGDSHTYGAGVEEEEAYPARLQVLLREKGVRVNVVNLGAPGTNTSEIRAELPVLLDRYKPAAVIVLAGVNNGWNRRDAALSDSADGIDVPFIARAAEIIQARVRIVRALTVTAHRLQWAGPPEEMARNRDGSVMVHRRLESWTVESAEKTYDRAQRDLLAIIAAARAAHAVPVLMTYVSDPEFTFETPNLLLREVAAKMNVPLADNDRAMKPLFMRDDGTVDPEARKALFMPDMHPAPEGYEKIAGNVARTLEAAGVVEIPSGK